MIGSPPAEPDGAEVFSAKSAAECAKVWKSDLFKEMLSKFRDFLFQPNVLDELSLLPKWYLALRQVGIYAHPKDTIAMGKLNMKLFDQMFQNEKRSYSDLNIITDVNGYVDARQFNATIVNERHRCNVHISISKEFFALFSSRNDMLYFKQIPSKDRFIITPDFSELERLFKICDHEIIVSIPTKLELSKVQMPFRSMIARQVLTWLHNHFFEIESQESPNSYFTHRWNPTCLPLDALLVLVEETKTVLKTEKALLSLREPTYVIGDLHGNYRDLMKFAHYFGMWFLDVIPNTNFLFMGDYVDRGPHPIEVLAFLCANKILFPDKVFLIRGNHETRSINSDYSAYRDTSFLAQIAKQYGITKAETIDETNSFRIREDELKPFLINVEKEIVDDAPSKSLIELGEKYPFLKLWLAFNDLFDLLPIAATIQNSIFCVHGGIPRTIEKDNSNPLFALEKRALPITSYSSDVVIRDLLWSDPTRIEEDTGLAMFTPSDRGAENVNFTRRAVSRFTSLTGCTHIIRAHQPQKIGISFSKNARVVTVFSSSNYDEGNSSAALLVANQKIQPIIFSTGADFEDE